MRFAVFTHVEHYKDDGKFYAYSPYVREMNMWFNHLERIDVVAPLTLKEPEYTTEFYNTTKLQLNPINSINFLSVKSSLTSLAIIPVILFEIFRVMKKADHLHLRCPGNIGLLASIVQVFFPSKPKTVKYAGNWNESSGQPLSYRFQKWILSNELLSKNIRVLVYGEGGRKSRNIVPFFTASFAESDKNIWKKEFTPPFQFIFAGSLVEGKRPMFAIKLIEELNNSGIPVTLDIFGTGKQWRQLNEYITKRKLFGIVSLWGSQDLEVLKQGYKKAHFVILPSKSEGWPKALAEGMFYGCIPISTPVSCVPWMLGNGQRGVLISNDVDDAKSRVQELIESKETLEEKSLYAQKWAQKYTLEQFEEAIKEFL